MVWAITEMIHDPRAKSRWQKVYSWPSYDHIDRFTVDKKKISGPVTKRGFIWDSGLNEWPLRAWVIGELLFIKRNSRENH